MHGWNIIYALINFLILAAGLFFIGRKIVVNAIRAHADKVNADLEQSAASRENAKKLLDGLEGESAKGESEREEILRQAQAGAEDILRAGQERRRGRADRAAGERGSPRPSERALPCPSPGAAAHHSGRSERHPQPRLFQDPCQQQRGAG